MCFKYSYVEIQNASSSVNCRVNNGVLLCTSLNLFLSLFLCFIYIMTLVNELDSYLYRLLLLSIVRIYSLFSSFRSRDYININFVYDCVVLKQMILKMKQV